MGGEEGSGEMSLVPRSQAAVSALHLPEACSLACLSWGFWSRPGTPPPPAPLRDLGCHSLPLSTQHGNLVPAFLRVPTGSELSVYL